MRIGLLIILTFCLSKLTLAQTTYESPFGFTLSFDKTWKRLPKEVLQQRMKDVKDFLEYRKDIQFDACYQKIGNADMDYPYILFKNVYATTNNEDEIKKVQEYFTNKPQFEKVIENLVNGKFGVELKVGKNYYDAKNKILIFTYDMGISIKGNLVGMFAFYFGKNASLITYCYSYKDEFKYDQKEFLDVIYSIKDKGMVNTMGNYVSKHDLAVKYYNDGKKSIFRGPKLFHSKNNLLILFIGFKTNFCISYAVTSVKLLLVNLITVKFPGKLQQMFNN
jgi:hypothetical protein